MKKWLSLALAMCLLLIPALGAEEAVSAADQAPSAWSLPYLADARALKLVDDGYAGSIKGPVTAEEVAALAEVVYGKLALLTGAAEEFAWEKTGNARGDVVEALGAALRTAGVDDAEAVEALQALNVLQGDGVSLALERACTCEEAVTLAVRTVLAVYDGQNAGSRGFLWKATHGGNTVYLLGTAHMDRGNLYPFHQTLRKAIQSADTVVLELDFQDPVGIEEYAAMQVYDESDSLKNHIPEALYTRTVNAFSNAMGVPEEQLGQFKPWALALTVTSLLTSDETAGDAPLAIDLYIDAAARNAGKRVTGAETYAFQGEIFDTLSPDYQAAYLDSAVTLLETASADGSQEMDPEAQAALEAQEKMMDDMMTAWQTADLALFGKIYDKEAIVTSDDEVNARLFTDRDPGMVEVARRCLELEGENTTFIAFGAGHMVAPGGVVPELEKLGYAVEQVTEY